MSFGQEVWNMILTCGIGLIAYLLKDWKSSLEKKAQDEKDRLDKLEEKFYDLRAHLPSNYVSRDDFIRAIAGLDTRLEKGLSTIGKQIQDAMNKIQQKGG